MQTGKSGVAPGQLSFRIVGHAIDSSPITRPLVGVIIIAALASLFDAGDAYLYGFAIPGIAKEFGAKPAQLGLIGSFTLLGMCLGSFMWGWIADKYGRKPAFTLTLLMFSVLCGVCGLAPSIGFLYGARFCMGLGIGGSIPVDASILAEFAPARIRGYSGGALPIAWPVSTFIASSVALVVLPRYGWRGLFFVGVVPALLVFWIRRNVPESPRWLANRGRFEEARKALHYLDIKDDAIERSRIAVQNEPPLPMLPPAVFRDLFTPEMRRRTIHTWILWVLPLMASWGMNFWIPQLFVKFYGLPLQSAVKNMLYISFFSIAGRFLVYFLSEKVGRKFFITLGFSMAGILLFPMIGVHTAIAFFWFAAFYQFFMEMGLCGSTIYVPEVYPLHIRVLGASTAMGLGRIGGAIGSYVIGYCVGAQMMTQCWIFLGATSLIAGLATIWLGIEPKGQNLEQLNKDGTIGAAKLHKEEVAEVVGAK
ncbi:MAG: MFS transporter [Candidatus Korobacteraceae bacterium]|jgi:putative MFS transporter